MLYILCLCYGTIAVIMYYVYINIFIDISSGKTEFDQSLIDVTYHGTSPVTEFVEAALYFTGLFTGASLLPLSATLCPISS